jgi:predicted DNA-binding protein YlxM (UPF0122 family)
LLFDFYAPLLTRKQCSIWDSYYQMNLSMVEIARQRNTTRQAVHALLKRTEEGLELYEKKMGLIERFLTGKELLLQLDKQVQTLQADTVTDSVTDTVTGSVTDPVTDSEADPVTDTEADTAAGPVTEGEERLSQKVAEIRALIQKVLDTY